MEKNNPYIDNNKIMTEMNTMTSITEKFFTGCKQMEKKEDLEEYKKKALDFSERSLLEIFIVFYLFYCEFLNFQPFFSNFLPTCFILHLF